MKPKHQRLFLVITSLMFLCSATLLVMKSFRSNIVYFYTPSEIISAPVAGGQTIRAGGVVKPGSFKPTADLTEMEFIISDGKQEIFVHYKGMLPTLFRTGQGVIVEGTMKDGNVLQATTVLAKHDENYMPKEVVESLKKSGYWQKAYGR